MALSGSVVSQVVAPESDLIQGTKARIYTLDITLGDVSADYDSATGLDLANAVFTTVPKLNAIISVFGMALRQSGGTVYGAITPVHDAASGRVVFGIQGNRLVKAESVNVGNGAGAETVLGSASFGANRLVAAAGTPVIEVEAWGTTSNNGNTDKVVGLRLGGLSGDDLGHGYAFAASQTLSWCLRSLILVTGGGATQEAITTVTASTSAGANSTNYAHRATGAQDLTLASSVAITGNGTGANDVVLKGYRVSVNEVRASTPTPIIAAQPDLDFSDGDILRVTVLGV